MLWQDLGFAVRLARKHPGFGALATFTLSLGIGATTAIFSVVYAVLLQPLSYQDPGRLVQVWNTGGGDPRQPVLFPDFETWKAKTKSFEDLTIYYKNTGFSRATLTGGAEPDSVQGGFVSANLFPMLGVPPAVGRAFTPAEEARREAVAVLSHGLWMRRFASSLDAIGKTLDIDGAPYRVIGVMPSTFQFPARDTQFWAPITTNRFWLDRLERDGTHVRGFYARWNVVGRLKRGVSIQQAQMEMALFAPRLEQTDPVLNNGIGIDVTLLQVEVASQTRLALFLLFAVVAAILPIACANVAGLFLARGIVREREMAIRTALGAGRSRLVRQLLTESVAFSVVSACGGLLLAAPTLQALIAFGPRDLPRLEEARLNPVVLGFTFVISVLAALACGIVPAWKASRSDPNDSLKSVMGGSSQSRGMRHVQDALVVVEFAIAVVLLIGSGLLIRSFLALTSVDPGFEPQHVLTMRIALPDTARRAAFYADALERMRAVPGVQAVGAVDRVFELGSTGTTAPAGPPQSGGDLRVYAIWKSISGDYPQAMGLRLLRGRYLSSADGPGAPLVAIIDEAMARRYWPGEDPIGKRFKGQDPRGKNDDWVTVVGVVHDLRSHGLEALPSPHVYQPAVQSDLALSELVVRTSGDPAALAATVRSIVRTLDQTAVLSAITTVEQQFSDQIAPRRFQTSLLTLFSLIALVLGSVGIYGVMQQTVAQRTREIGVRMALGARAADVLAMVLREGLSLALIGVTIGLGAAYWITRLIESILFEVAPTDPATYAAVSVMLVVVAAAAISIPGWRAARIDPLGALRQE
jgi:putative ABC transport system permease protein